MHYQQQSECQADDDYLKDSLDNLLNLLSGSSFVGYVTYTGGCQLESAGDALAGSTCYMQVESYSGSNYWDPSPQSSSAPDAGGSGTSWPSPSAEASPSGRRLSESYSDSIYPDYQYPDYQYPDYQYPDHQYPGFALPPSTPGFFSDSIYWDSQYPGFALPPSTPTAVCGCEEMGVKFCNYKYDYYGFCDSCGDVASSPCDQRGLPDAGVADCEACCNVSHPYPHPRPNCSGS